MNTTQETTTPAAPVTAAVPAAGAAPRTGGFQGRPSFGQPGANQGGPRGARRPGGPGAGPRRGGPRDQKERVKPEFDSKIISIRRVTRVASGGRRFTFSVAVVAGDKKGKVGVGLGKAGDTSLAIDKATRDAKKHMIKVRTTPTMSIPHQIEAKFCSSRVMMMPVAGRGLVAGSSVRTVLELAGLKDVVAKLLSGSKNKVNNARVAIEALSSISTIPRPTREKAAAKEAAAK